MMQAALDKEIFCARVIENQETLFRTAKAILRNDEDAEDAVQEAICAAFERRQTLRDADKFRPWLLRILANKCYDACRKRRPSVDLSEVEECLRAPDADPTERMTLWQAVMTLGDDLRAPVTLFYYEDMTEAEIAKTLGIAKGTVKSRLSRARNRLKTLLEEEDV